MSKSIVKKLDKTGHSEKYFVKQSTNQLALGFSDMLVHIWGNPSEERLNAVIQAFVNKYGFQDEEKF